MVQNAIFTLRILKFISMKKILSLVLLFFSIQLAFGVESPKPFLIAKNEYKELENTNKLINRAIENTFGFVSETNNYSINIKKVDAWNEEVSEFRYFPEVDAEKKTQLNKSVLKSEKNILVNYKVTVNIEKSFLSSKIRAYLDENSAFVLPVIIVGDERIYVTETTDKTVFDEMVNDLSFTDKAFKSFFGVNVMNLNYHIEVLKTSACFIKDITKADCKAFYEINKTDTSYREFAAKITSKEYSSAFVFFDVLITKEKSRLTQKANDAIIRDADRSEHIRFYFCIPKNNTNGGSGNLINIEGKIVGADNKIVPDIMVELRDASNKTISSCKSDANGFVKFQKIDDGLTYTMFIDKSVKADGYKLATVKDKIIGKFKKNILGFDYKLLEADMRSMQEIEVPDPVADFVIKIKARMVVVTDKINPLVDQMVQLKNSENKVLQTKRTDKEGNFELSDVDLKEIYTIELPEYKEKLKNEKVYLSNTKNELVARVLKNSEGKFSYKTIPADMITLSSAEEEDPSFSFNKQMKLNTADIVIRDFVYYEVGSAVLSEQAKATLAKVIKVAQEHPEFNIEIISHTDSRGKNEENMKLSQKRSEAVMDYFIKNTIDQKRIKPSGKGETSPLNTCTDGVKCTEEEYKMNRRTEFKFSK